MIFMKTFITVGTHPQQFNRLLQKIDELIAVKKIRGEVICQSGYSNYKPKNFELTPFFGLEEFEKKIKEADLIITHAGEGNIGLCKNLNKKMIVIPRKKEFEEHTNNHQLELAKVVEEKKIGLAVWKINELEEKLKEIENFTPARIEKGKINQLLEEFVKKEFST